MDSFAKGNVRKQIELLTQRVEKGVTLWDQIAIADATAKLAATLNDGKDKE